MRCRFHALGREIPCVDCAREDRLEADLKVAYAAVDALARALADVAAGRRYKGKARRILIQLAPTIFAAREKRG